MTAATALTILYTRSAHTLYFSAGALLSTLTGLSPDTLPILPTD